MHRRVRGGHRDAAPPRTKTSSVIPKHVPGRRRISILLVSAVVMLIALTIGGSVAGRLLVIANPLQPARSVVVLGGHVPFRAMEAAAVYKQGWAREVWLTQGAVHDEDRALAKLGIERTPDYVYDRLVLQRSGVPDAAIRVLADRTVNTADELRTIAKAVSAAGDRFVILITSKYHSRRVKVIWRIVADDR